LRFLDLFLALFNLALVFLQNGGARIAEHHIKDIDSILGLLRQHASVNLFNNIFKDVPLLETFYKFFK